MGFTRKLLSVNTLGLIDYKSDKERMAASARKTKQAARKTNALLREQNRLIAEGNQQASADEERIRNEMHAAAARAKATREAEANAATAPTAPPPGWYDDPDGGSGKRWWDGSVWTEHRNT